MTAHIARIDVYKPEKSQSIASKAAKGNVVLNNPVFLDAWTEYYDDCTPDSSGSWNVSITPTHGSWTTQIIMGELSNGDCPGVMFPFNALYYTWTDAAAKNGSTDQLAATWTTPDGESSGLETFNFVLGALLITSPTTGSDFQLSQNNYTSTDTVSYSADAGDTSTPINWTNKLVYATSGGKGKYSGSQSFSTQPSATQTEQYASKGGQLTAMANQGNFSDKTVVTITGAAIPSDTVTSRLASLYSGGATPDLLEQIATYESNYQQFTTSTLFDVTALWPTESLSDGGSHIGLMMVPVKNGIEAAFDWTQNSQQGASVLQGNLGLAATYENKLVKANPGLPKPTGVMLENEALSIYRVGTKYNYYKVVKDNKGKPTWVENTDGDPTGTGYADCVRIQTPPTHVDCSENGAKQ